MATPGELSDMDIHDRVSAKLCQWIYRDNPAVPATLEWDIAGCGPGVCSVHRLLPMDTRSGTSLHMAIATVEFPGHKALYVVFRGTKYLHDWLANVNIQYNSIAYSRYHVAVHTVFHQALENRREAWTRELLERLRAAARDRAGPATRLVVTGHSQGGALATAFFGILKMPAPPLFPTVWRRTVQHFVRNARLVTFGAPMVFSKVKDTATSEFRPISEVFLAHMRNGRNYVYRNDPVPRAYSHLPIRKCLVEGPLAWRPAGRLLGLARRIPGRLGARLAGAVAWVDGRLLSTLDTWVREYEQLAEGYVHVVELALIDGRRRWEDYDFGISCFEDHLPARYMRAFDLNRPTAFFAPTPTRARL